MYINTQLLNDIFSFGKYRIYNSLNLFNDESGNGDGNPHYRINWTQPTFDNLHILTFIFFSGYPNGDLAGTQTENNGNICPFYCSYFCRIKRLD